MAQGTLKNYRTWYCFFSKDNGYDIILCDEYITQDFSNENSPKFKTTQ